MAVEDPEDEDTLVNLKQVAKAKDIDAYNLEQLTEPYDAIMPFRNSSRIWWY